MTADTVCEFEDGSGVAPVRGLLHRPVQPSAAALVLTHGAGSNCRTRLLAAVSAAFAQHGLTILRCDLAFRQARPHGPPRSSDAARDRATLRAAASLMRGLGAGRIFLGGHSYGGRQASMLAAEEPALVDGLLLLSYPLHPPGRPTFVRTAHFPALRAPTLFVHAAADPFGTLAELAAGCELIPVRSELLPVAGARHDLSRLATDDGLLAEVVRRFQALTGWI